MLRPDTRARKPGWRDAVRANRNLASLRPYLPPDGDHQLRLALRQTPDADTALNYIERYVVSVGYPAQQLFQSSRRLHAAAAIFSHSQYLADTLLRHPQLLDWALEEEQLYRVLSGEEMYTELGARTASLDDDKLALTLARFKRMHLLRIALRDLLGLATLAEVTLELSNLTDAILHGARERLRQQLMQRFGRPLVPAEGGPLESRFVVLALGKLGGRELNYSSDIDLMYLYTGDGETTGPIKTSNKDFFIQLAQRLTDVMSKMTPEGFAYRVDLRLRPDGTMGEIVIPLNAAVEYYHRRGRDWELQMLIKARPTAGYFDLGDSFLRMIEPLIYRTSTDFSTIERVAETRDRIQQKLRHRSKRGLDIKLARGGIRDIEFLVQCFQRLYGGSDSWVRSGGTLFALHRLQAKGYLSMPDYGRLDSAYQFLRTLEHRLQLIDNRQTHSLPTSDEELALLERKMNGLIRPSGSGLQEQVKAHLQGVAEIYERVIHTQRPTKHVPVEEPPRETVTVGSDDTAAHSWRSHLRHLESRSPGLASAVEALPIRRGTAHFGHFLDKIVSDPALLREFEGSRALLECVGDLIEHSSPFAEQLIRHPEDIGDIKAIALAAKSAEQRPQGKPPRGPERFEIGLSAGQASTLEESSTLLRRGYRRGMLQIQAESVFGRHPIFSTLCKTSDLADEVIRAAYEIAVTNVCLSTGRPRPEAQLQVIALGRLGMREFDLASDADLVFVVPDEAADERGWWVHVVERLIEIISSYTREGMIFTVDTRLRPMGRDGELVRSESSYRQYFAERAEAWEALTYMKARTVAGDLPRGAQFLSTLQDLAWHRYGLSSDLARLLLDMRNRIEKEQGRERPIKAGAGGYYDIDFILMYLRLRDAGIFFESLTTPERIQVIQTMGGLTAQQASLLEDTAVFFRALDHAIRVASGHSTSKIPTSVAQQQNLGNLLGRWSKIKTAAQPLASLVQEVRQRTRAVFLETFGVR